MNPYSSTAIEADLIDAMDRNDEATITRLGGLLDSIPEKPAVTLHSAALYYASIGLHVFPLQPRSKIPMRGSGGCKDATTDPELITRWWTGNPSANIGIATGFLIDVVDIDGPKGQASRVEHWESTFETIDRDAIARVLTPRPGGMHLMVPATGDGNSAGIFPGIDYRGVGGYVVAPPSRTDVGSYRFLGTPDLTKITQAVA